MSLARRTIALVTLVPLAACGDKGGNDPSESFTHPEGAVAATLTLAARPFGAAISSRGVGLVTQLDNRTVRVVNVAEGTVGASITVGETPTRITFSPSGDVAYVSNQSSRTIGIIDMSTLTQTTTIPLPGSPFATAVSANGSRLYVGTTTDRVYVINTATRAIIDSVDVGSYPNGIVLSSEGSRYWVANAYSGTVTEVNASTNDVTRTFQVDGVPQDVAVTRDGRRLFVSNEGGWIDVIDLQTGTIGEPVELDAGAFGMVITPDQSQLLVALSGGSAVRVISTSSLATVKDITVGGLPRRIAIDRSGSRALVASENGTATIIR